MTPFFLLTTPRSKGTLLMRMLDATPGVTCAGEHTALLQRLRGLQGLPAKLAEKHEGEPWPMHRQSVEGKRWDSGISAMLEAFVAPGASDTHYGIRSSFLGKEGWTDACDSWSWLLATWPEAKIVFLGRDQGEVELSMLATPSLWRPHYGTCPGVCGGKVLHHLNSMQDFHELNPGRTALLDAADLDDFDVTASELARVGIPLDRGAWEAERAIISGTRKEAFAQMESRKPVKAPEHPLFDPATTTEQALRIAGVEPVDETLEAWKRDPFGESEKVVRAVPPTAGDWPIVIPLHSKGGKHRNNGELKFALRSLEQNFKGKLRVVIVGEKLPDWGRGLGHIVPRKKGLKAALAAAAAAFPEGFFWFYDDCCLLRATTPAEMRITSAKREWNEAVSTKWSRMLDIVRLRLVAEGIEPVDYSRPHGPYWFDKAMIDEAFADWPRMKGKFPFESWILAKRRWPAVFGAFRQYYGAFNEPPKPGKRYLTYNNRGNSLELRAWLRGQFPQPSTFEKS